MLPWYAIILAQNTKARHKISGLHLNPSCVTIQVKILNSAKKNKLPGCFKRINFIRDPKARKMRENFNAIKFAL